MIDSRWRACLHEAGHGAAAIATGGAVDAITIGSVSGGYRGSCLAKSRSPIDDAFCVAAGPASERLLSHISAPELPPSTPAELPTTQSVHLAGRTVSPAWLIGGSPPSDDCRIALWAISGVEDQPERWAGRVAWVHAEAESIIRHNAGLVLQLARELFIRGVLSSDEINELLRGKSQ